MLPEQNSGGYFGIRVIRRHLTFFDTKQRFGKDLGCNKFFFGSDIFYELFFIFLTRFNLDQKLHLFGKLSIKSL